MPDLREQLRQLLQGRVCLMGLGNVDYGDDGFGVRLVATLAKEGGAGTGAELSACRTQYAIAGTMPERFLGQPAAAGCDHLIFVDAVDFGGMPGSTILLNSGQMSACYPQLSTHKLSLGLLAKWAEANGTTRAWLLGVQPESLRLGERLGPTVQATLELLVELLRSCLAGVREGERPREPKHPGTPEQIRAREDARSPGRELEVMA